MELTRRDAAAAVAAVGVGGVGLAVHRAQRDRTDPPESAADLLEDGPVRRTMVAVAEVIYPTDVTGIGEFVTGLLDRRLERPGHARAVRETVTELDRLARSWYGAPVFDLAADEREEFLRAVGADTAEEDPTGTTAEQVRYYVINELLLALYASPTGGELVGIENPQGFAGGTESYARGPR